MQHEIRSLEDLYNTIRGVELFLDDIKPKRKGKIDLKQLAKSWEVKQ